MATVFSNQLKLLANAIHPETGEILPETSICHRPDVIRIIFALADELGAIDRLGTKTKKPKLSLADRRKKNISENRPPKSNFPWGDDEKNLLALEYGKIFTRHELERLANKFERSNMAIAAQLYNLGLISTEEREVVRSSEQKSASQSY